MPMWYFLIFLLSLFQTCYLSFPSPSSQLCLHDERSALLQLKQKHYNIPPKFNYPVPPNLRFDLDLNYHLLMPWMPNTDCCYWEGITCNGTTGHVIGLDLYNSLLYGSIHSNSSLFHLHHLQMLNLSYNNFLGQIPSQISQLTDLISLNLSFNSFSGQIPLEISSLTKLTSLDLSYNGYFHTRIPQLEIPNLKAFVQDLSSLKELRLDGVNLSAQKNRDWCRHLSSSLPNLQVLSMGYCSLTGPLDASISNLRFLSVLNLRNNPNISSMVPSSLMNLTSLTFLRLLECGFHGDFPSNIFHLPNLKVIDLHSNLLLSVHLPEFPRVNNTLQYLHVGNTIFPAKSLSLVGNLKSLKILGLEGLNFSGPIPHSLANLTHLTLLDLSYNSFSGQIPSFFKGRLPNLEQLYLHGNLLQGPIHSYLFFLPSLHTLVLSNNQFSEVINEPIHNISSFSGPWKLDLSGNYLEGQELMRSISKIIGTFHILDLSFNDFSYIVEDTNLSYDSAFNAQIQVLVMVSCNISKFPNFLRNQKELGELDISNNRIDGVIPKWIWQKNLIYLNLSDNFFTGLELPLPNHSNIEALDLHSNMIQDECLSTAPCSPQTFNQSHCEFVSPILGNLTSLLSEASLFFSISNNKLTGKIPFSICNASHLDILDLSNNQLSGTIPTCFGSSNLGVLNLEGNKLHGPIPHTFKNGCNLHTLMLNQNMLQGKLPRSLGNCKGLNVLNVADNQLNDSFPFWLENLSELQVLVMRSNKFGGPIVQLPHAHNSPFPSLHVIDISFNNFTGNLPLHYICHWKAMMSDGDASQLNYTSEFNSIYSKNVAAYYQETLAIMDKGQYMKMRILTIFTSVDLSNNNFEGKIPDALGNLRALVVLNLSRNSLTGQIPFSFKNLSELESLDLSRNKLSGEIPRQLTSLTFLSVLNLSYNNFVGSIPLGNQFNTFSDASYEGNAGLCGLPLSRTCGITDRALPPTSAVQQKDDSSCLLDWTFALAGYCSGLIVGLVIGQQLFWRKNRCSKFVSRVVASKQRKGSRKIIKHCNRGN